MRRCEHSDDLRKASTDLRCPLCMEAEIARLRAALQTLLEKTDYTQDDVEAARRALEGKE
jgi:hypothetical protein